MLRSFWWGAAYLLRLILTSCGKRTPHLKILADSIYQNFKENINSYLSNIPVFNNLTLGLALLLVLLVPLCGCLVSCWMVVDLETWLLAGRLQLNEDGASTVKLYTFFTIVFSNTFI